MPYEEIAMHLSMFCAGLVVGIFAGIGGVLLLTLVLTPKQPKRWRN